MYGSREVQHNQCIPTGCYSTGQKCFKSKPVIKLVKMVVTNHEWDTKLIPIP